MIERHHGSLPRSLGWAVLCSCATACAPHVGPSLAVDGAASAEPSDGVHWLKPTRGIRGIFEDSQGRLWFTSTDWACRYDPAARDSADGGFTYFAQSDIGVVTGGFQEDADGRILMQNVDGIHVYDDGRFTPVANRNYGAGNPWEKADGDLWFGVDGGFELGEREGQWGVYRYRDGECTFLAFPIPAGDRDHFYPLTSAVMHAEDGTLWFGTFEAAFGFDGESFDIVGREKMGRADDPRDIGIRGYHLDSRGNLWLADNGAGVYVYDGDTVVHFTAMHGLRDEDTDGSSLQRAFSIAEDGDGNYWFGTVYSGIWRYEPSEHDPVGEGTFTNFGGDRGCPSETIWTMYLTRSGELLFVGENPGGVYRFDGRSFERAF